MAFFRIAFFSLFLLEININMTTIHKIIANKFNAIKLIMTAKTKSDIANFLRALIQIVANIP